MNPITTLIRTTPRRSPAPARRRRDPLWNRHHDPFIDGNARRNMLGQLT